MGQSVILKVYENIFGLKCGENPKVGDQIVNKGLFIWIGLIKMWHVALSYPLSLFLPFSLHFYALSLSSSHLTPLGSHPSNHTNSSYPFFLIYFVPMTNVVWPNFNWFPSTCCTLPCIACCQLTAPTEVTARHVSSAGHTHQWKLRLATAFKPPYLIAPMLKSDDLGIVGLHFLRGLQWY